MHSGLIRDRANKVALEISCIAFHTVSNDPTSQSVASLESQSSNYTCDTSNQLYSYKEILIGSSPLTCDL
jgi:hypothetical protein